MKFERLNRADEVQREIQNTELALRHSRDRVRNSGLIERLRTLRNELKDLGKRTYIPNVSPARGNGQRQQARQERLRELRRMPYAQYLKSTEWQKARRKALKHAEYRCQLCNQADRLNVHHRNYSRLGAEKDADLIVLCENCHSKFHDKLP